MPLEKGDPKAWPAPVRALYHAADESDANERRERSIRATGIDGLVLVVAAGCTASGEFLTKSSIITSSSKSATGHHPCPPSCSLNDPALGLLSQHWSAHPERF